METPKSSGTKIDNTGYQALGLVIASIFFIGAVTAVLDPGDYTGIFLWIAIPVILLGGYYGIRE